jgi:hypothetical protein
MWEQYYTIQPQADLAGFHVQIRKPVRNQLMWSRTDVNRENV